MMTSSVLVSIQALSPLSKVGAAGAAAAVVGMLVIFLFGYSAARISLELVRQPDPQFGPTGNVFLDMTMGQTLSTVMVVGGVLILLLSRRRDPAPGSGSSAAG